MSLDKVFGFQVCGVIINKRVVQKPGASYNILRNYQFEARSLKVA